VKLIDLAPRWFAEPGRRGQGIVFRCPCCIGTPKQVALAVAFANPLDGAAPISLLSDKLWPALRPPEGEADITMVPPGIHWGRSGDTFDALSIMPSVDASPAGHWHGHIVNGEVC